MKWRLDYRWSKTVKLFNAMYRDNSNNNNNNHDNKKQPQTNDLPRQPANQELRWLESKVLSPLEFSKYEERKIKNNNKINNK